MTRPLSSDVIVHKVEQAKALERFQRSLGLEPFHPISALLKNGKHSPLVPPVLELRNGALCVAEGHSRLYVQWARQIEATWSFVLTDVEKPMHGPPRYWREIRLDDERAKSAFANDPDARLNARDIERYVHANLFDSPSEGSSST